MAALFGTPVYLQASESLRLVEGAGLEVKCIRGHLWITQHGDLEDRIIDRGQSFVLNRPGLSLVTALGELAVVVVSRASGVASRPLRHAA